MVRLVRVLTVVAILGSTGSGIAWSQQAPAEEAGLEFLDQAMQKKLASRNMKDLDTVVTLGKQALAEGLSADDQKFAKQLIGSTLYEKAERLNQTLTDSRINLAWARRRQLALESVRQAMEFAPDDPEVYLLHAQLHQLGGGDSEEGLKSATRAVELLSEHPARRAVALISLANFTTDPQKRLEYLDQAVQDAPTSLEARRVRAAAKLATNDLEGAVDDFQFVLENDSADIESLQRVAQILVRQDKIEEALERIDANIRSNPEEPGGYTLRSSVYLVQEKFDLAEVDLDKALELNPRSIATLLARARLFQLKGDYKEALADATRVLELEPGLLPAVFLRCEIAISAGNYTRAISDLRRLLREQPQDVPLRMQLASVYMADENPQMAINTYDQILRDHPEEWDAVRGRADALLNTGDHATAIREYERVMDVLPDDNGILNNLAWVLATSTMDELRDGPRAVQLATKACEATEYKAAHILSTLAAGYAELGDFDAAIAWSTKAVALGKGEIRQQLAAELESYREQKPWRERQTIKSDEASLAEALKADIEGTKDETPAIP